MYNSVPQHHTERNQGLAGKRIHGGTTIAGTMILARLAGIKVFATGGLGALILIFVMGLF